MAVSVPTNGGGSLRYRAFENGGAYFKTPLAGREGFLVGVFFRTPATFASAGGQNTILGGNSNSLIDGPLAGLQGIAIAQRGPTASDPRRMMTPASGSNTSTNRMWPGLPVSGVWAGMTAPDNPSVQFMTFGARNVGAPGANDFRVFRAIIPRFGDAASAQVEIGTPDAGWVATTVQFINQIFVGSQGTASAATYTSAGTAVEHVGVVEGAFPFSGGLPDTAVMAQLASGLMTYDGLADLIGGDVTSWRPLRSIADTTGIGSSPSDVHPLIMRGTVLTDGEVLGPGLWNPAGFSINEKPNAYVFEGVLGPSSVKFDGPKQAGQLLNYRFLREDGSVLVDWTNVGLTYPSSTQWAIQTSLPLPPNGMYYRLELQDAAIPTNVISAANLFGVGPVYVGPHDQSTKTIMAEDGKPATANGARTSVAPNRCSVAYATSRSNVPVAQFQVARLNSPSSYGSGYTSMADEIGRRLGPNHYPTMFVDVAVAGKPITDWLNDVLHTDTNPATWRLWSGYMAFMAQNCDFRATAFIKGNAVSGNTATIQALAALYDSLWVNNVAQNQVWLTGPWRNNSLSPAITVQTREDIRALDTGTSRFKVLAHLPDIQLAGNGDNHQAAGEKGFSADFNTAALHAMGNIRAGLKYGLGVAYRTLLLLGITPTFLPFGPRIVAAAFTDAGRTAIDLTYDRDIRTHITPATNLPQFWVTTNNWTAKEQAPAAIIGPRTVRLSHPTAGNWLNQTVRVDYCRDTPWQPTGTHVPGGEVNIAPFLNALIYDTTDFEDGRGVVAQPILANGIAVTDASSVAVGPAIVPVRVGSAAAGFAGPVQVASARVSLRVGTAVAGFTPSAPLPPTIMDVSLPPPRLLDGWGRRIKKLFGGSN